MEPSSILMAVWAGIVIIGLLTYFGSGLLNK
jgi:hypothetical protein